MLLPPVDDWRWLAYHACCERRTLRGDVGGAPARLSIASEAHFGRLLARDAAFLLVVAVVHVLALLTLDHVLAAGLDRALLLGQLVSRRLLGLGLGRSLGRVFFAAGRVLCTLRPDLCGRLVVSDGRASRCS